MKIVNSIRLPEALRTSKTGSLWYAAAGMSIFKGLSGRLWTVSAWPEDVVDVVPTGVVLPDDSYDPLDCAAGRLVVEHADNALVYDLDTGRLVIEVRNYVNESDGLCLTPHGKLLFCFSEEYTSVYILNDPAAAPNRTEVFNQTGSPQQPKSEPSERFQPRDWMLWLCRRMADIDCTGESARHQSHRAPETLRRNIRLRPGLRRGHLPLPILLPSPWVWGGTGSVGPSDQRAFKLPAIAGTRAEARP